MFIQNKGTIQIQTLLANREVANNSKGTLIMLLRHSIATETPPAGCLPDAFISHTHIHKWIISGAQEAHRRGFTNRNGKLRFGRHHTERPGSSLRLSWALSSPYNSRQSRGTSGSRGLMGSAELLPCRGSSWACKTRAAKATAPSHHISVSSELEEEFEAVLWVCVKENQGLHRQREQGGEHGLL